MSTSPTISAAGAPAPLSMSEVLRVPLIPRNMLVVEHLGIRVGVILQRVKQILMRSDICRVEFHCPSKVRNGAIDLAKVLEDNSNVIMV